jgi:hypothetical protein
MAAVKDSRGTVDTISTFQVVGSLGGDCERPEEGAEEEEHLDGELAKELVAGGWYT